MSKYHFIYRLQTTLEADSLKEAKEMFEAMSLEELFSEEDTLWDELEKVQDENYKDVTQEYDSVTD